MGEQPPKSPTLSEEEYQRLEEWAQQEATKMMENIRPYVSVPPPPVLPDGQGNLEQPEVSDSTITKRAAQYMEGYIRSFRSGVPMTVTAGILHEIAGECGIVIEPEDAPVDIVAKFDAKLKSSNVEEEPAIPEPKREDSEHKANPVPIPSAYKENRSNQERFLAAMTPDERKGLLSRPISEIYEEIGKLENSADTEDRRRASALRAIAEHKLEPKPQASPSPASAPSATPEPAVAKMNVPRKPQGLNRLQADILGEGSSVGDIEKEKIPVPETAPIAEAKPDVMEITRNVVEKQQKIWTPDEMKTTVASTPPQESAERPAIPVSPEPIREFEGVEEHKQVIPYESKGQTPDVGSVAPEQPQAPDATPEKEEEEKQKTATKEIPQSVVEGFQKNYGISLAQLKELKTMIEIPNEGSRQVKFEDLSEGKQLLLLKNLDQFTLRDVEREAEQKFQEQQKNAGLLKSLFRGILTLGAYRGTRTANLEKEILSEKISGARFEENKVYLEQLLAGAAMGPDVSKKENGELEIAYASLSEILPTLKDADRLSPEEFQNVQAFNAAATAFAKLPFEWRYETTPLSSGQKKDFEAKKSEYEKYKSEMLKLKQKYSDEKEAAMYVNGLDEKLEVNQLLNSHPEAEKELHNIKEESAVWQGVKDFWKRGGSYAAYGAAFRAGTIWAAGAMTGGLAAIPVIALAGVTGGGVGALVGRKESQRMIEKERAAGREGEDIRKITENKKGVEARRKEFSDASFFVGRLNRLREEMEALPDDEAEETKKHRELLSKKLSETVILAREKLEQGLINFGKKDEQVKNKIDLLQGIGRGQVFAENDNDAFREKIAKAIEDHEEKIEGVRSKEARALVTKMALIRGGFATAGATMASLVHEFFFSNEVPQEAGASSVPAEIALDAKGAGASGGAPVSESATLASPGMKNPENVLSTQTGARPEGSSLMSKTVPISEETAKNSAIGNMNEMYAGRGEEAIRSIESGLQKKLTPEQLDALSHANTKEDVANIVSRIKEGKAPLSETEQAQAYAKDMASGKKPELSGGEKIQTAASPETPPPEATPTPAAPKETFSASDIINSKEVPGSDSIWKSTRTVFEKNASEFGYKGDIGDKMALRKWSQGQAANVWNEFEKIHSGSSRRLDLVHNEDKVTVRIVDGKPVLEVEYHSKDGVTILSSKQAEPLPQPPQTPSTPAPKGGEGSIEGVVKNIRDTVGKGYERVEDFAEKIAQEAGGIMKEKAAEGGENIIKNTGKIFGLDDVRVNENITMGVGAAAGVGIPALGYVGYVRNAELSKQLASIEGRYFGPKEKIKRENLTERSKWAEQVLESASKKLTGAEITTADAARREIAASVRTFFEESGADGKKEKGSTVKTTPDDIKNIFTCMSGLRDIIQNTRKRFGIENEKIPPQEGIFMKIVSNFEKNRARIKDLEKVVAAS